MGGEPAVIILSMRTDNPEAELAVYRDGEKLAYEKWEAHRQLAETIHKKVDEILNKSSNSLKDIDGIVCFKGPGSFTGLRIGLSIANALAYGLQVPIVAVGSNDWIEQGIKKLQAGNNDKIALPEYGASPHITKQRK